MNAESVKIVSRGNVIGSLQEMKIYDWIKTHDGRFWKFKEVAGPGIDRVLQDGDFCVIYPGIIYEHVKSNNQPN